MRLKLFRAPSVAAAMAQVREELGAEALILATRRTGTGVEITAALEHALQSPATGATTGAATGCASLSPGTPAPAPPDPAQLAELRWHGVPDTLATALAAGPLPETLPSRLRFAALPLDSHAAPLLLAGPPGAGKSLTVARLATRLVLAGVAPLVISADTERAGAAEQLAAFTRLLGLDLIVATDGLTLARALARRQNGAPVLIDTAGIDPFSAADQVAIATLGAAAGARSVLVLPAGLDPAEASDMAAAFRAAGATMMVATRLDLARRLGGILAASASAAGLALTEAGIGPGAADGLVPLTPAYLTGRLAASTRKAS